MAKEEILKRLSISIKNYEHGDLFLLLDMFDDVTLLKNAYKEDVQCFGILENISDKIKNIVKSGEENNFKANILSAIHILIKYIECEEDMNNLKKTLETCNLDSDTMKFFL